MGDYIPPGGRNNYPGQPSTYGAQNLTQQYVYQQKNQRVIDYSTPWKPPREIVGTNDPGAPKRSKYLHLLYIFAIINLILMSISLFQPWYESKYDTKEDELYFKYSFEGREDNYDDDVEMDKWDDFKKHENLKQLFFTTQLLVIAAIIMCVLLIIGGFLAARGKSKNFAVSFSIITVCLCIFTPVIFMIIQPIAIQDEYSEDETSKELESFWGTEEVEGVEHTWGPSLGWYLSIFGFVFALLGLIMAIKLPRAESIERTAKVKAGAGLTPTTPEQYQPPYQLTHPQQISSHYPPPTIQPTQLKQPLGYRGLAPKKKKSPLLIDSVVVVVIIIILTIDAVMFMYTLDNGDVGGSSSNSIKPGNSITAKELWDDWDTDSGNFKSLDNGDSVYIVDEIKEIRYLRNYVYTRVNWTIITFKSTDVTIDSFILGTLDNREMWGLMIFNGDLSDTFKAGDQIEVIVYISEINIQGQTGEVPDWYVGIWDAYQGDIEYENIQFPSSSRVFPVPQ